MESPVVRVRGVECHFQQYFSYIMGSVLLVEETGENHIVTDKLYNTNVVLNTFPHCVGFKVTTSPIT